MPVTGWLSDLHKTEDNVTRVRMFIARSTLENCFLPTDSVRGRWSVSGCLSGLISVSWALFPVSQLPRIWGLDCRPTSDWWTPAAGTSRVTPGQARPEINQVFIHQRNLCFVSRLQGLQWLQPGAPGDGANLSNWENPHKVVGSAQDSPSINRHSLFLYWSFLKAHCEIFNILFISRSDENSEDADSCSGSMQASEVQLFSCDIQ